MKNNSIATFKTKIKTKYAFVILEHITVPKKIHCFVLVKKIDCLFPPNILKVSMTYIKPIFRMFLKETSDKHFD